MRFASTYDIIRDYGGIISMYGEQGEGSSFNSSFEKAHEGERACPAEILSCPETILIVDDEEMIVEVTSIMLETIGYRTSAVRNGREAVEFYEKNQDKVDLIIMDMVMPGMNGQATFEILKKINPNLKVIVSSGYNLNGQEKRIIEQGYTWFLQKPFRMEDLSEKVREVLAV